MRFVCPFFWDRHLKPLSKPLLGYYKKANIVNALLVKISPKSTVLTPESTVIFFDYGLGTSDFGLFLV
jgi:hypothetical protein